MEKDKEIVEEKKEENAGESVDKIMNSVEKASKKQRKPFEWSEKRLEAFKKMREGLEMKNQITKKLKEEKSKSEKEEIKRRVREIMNYSQVAKEIEEEGSSSGEASSSEEEVKKKPKKKSHKETRAVAKPAKVEKIKKSFRILKINLFILIYIL